MENALFGLGERGSGHLRDVEVIHVGFPDNHVFEVVRGVADRIFLVAEYRVLIVSPVPTVPIQLACRAALAIMPSKKSLKVRSICWPTFVPCISAEDETLWPTEYKSL
jgi:hypothetical protein